MTTAVNNERAYLIVDLAVKWEVFTAAHRFLIEKETITYIDSFVHEVSGATYRAVDVAVSRSLDGAMHRALYSEGCAALQLEDFLRSTEAT